MEADTRFRYIYTAQNGAISRDKQLIDNLFPLNASENLELFRITDPEIPIHLGIIPKDGRNMLRKDVFQDLGRLNEFVKNITVEHDGKTWKYEDLCSKRNNICLENKVLSMEPRIENIIRGREKVRYPYRLNKFTSAIEEYLENLGGVTVDDESNIKFVEAMRFHYVLDFTNAKRQEINVMWKTEFIKRIKNKDFQHINVYVFSHLSIVADVYSSAKKLLLLSPIAFFAVLIFSMVTSMSKNCVRSKHWLGLAACSCAVLAIFSTFGLAFFCGLAYVANCLAIPALILGTEVDDSYVLIAAWKRTDPTESVEKRMATTFSQAAVSITITSFTNIISFCIGLSAPFPAIKMFCIYAAVSIAFTYVYQITFFGGCMALSGYGESKTCYKLGHDSSGHNNEKKVEKHLAVDNHYRGISFEKFLGSLLQMVQIKTVIIILFLLNLAIGIWGLQYANEGSRPIDSVNPQSQTAKFLKIYRQHFRKYSFPLHIVFEQPLNYADATTRNSIDTIVKRFEAHPYTADSGLTISWLEYFEMYINSTVGNFFTSAYEISEEKGFVEALQETFLKINIAMGFKDDIVFNEENDKIIASRIFLMSMGSSSIENDKDAILELAEIANRSPLKVKLYSILHNVVEQMYMIRGITLQLAWVTGILILAVFFAFVPDIKCALCVSVSVVCTIVETVGYMFLWGVTLDLHTVLILILAVGFSINYPTHIAFSFIINSSKDCNRKLQKSIDDVGVPIIQGTVSNILGALPLIFAGTVLFFMMFKIIFLVSVFTCFHSMLVLPSVLSILTTLFSKEKVTNGSTDKS